MLSLGQAPGAASSLPAAVIAGMREKLATPAGVSSYQQLQQWVEQTSHLRTTYTVIYYTATKVLDARLAVPRPSHEKNRGRSSTLPRRVSQPLKAGLQQGRTGLLAGGAGVRRAA